MTDDEMKFWSMWSWLENYAKEMLGGVDETSAELFRMSACEAILGKVANGMTVSEAYADYMAGADDIACRDDLFEMVDGEYKVNTEIAVDLRYADGNVIREAW